VSESTSFERKRRRETERTTFLVVEAKLVARKEQHHLGTNGGMGQEEKVKKKCQVERKKGELDSQQMKLDGALCFREGAGGNIRFREI